MHQFIVSQRRASRHSRSAVLETKGEETGTAGRGLRRLITGLDTPTVASATVCRIVRQLVLEMTALASERPLWRRDSRRSTCHVRQISMYVCHVALQLTMTDIASGFGRDRTTVGHACARVEDRRDDRAFDDLVGAVERVVHAVFAGKQAHG